MEVVASDIIRQNTSEYAKQILNNMFPNVIDGFKKVRRRILFTQPTDKPFGGQQLISNTIRIHPYGDMSIYETACKMTDPFRSTFQLLDIIGKGGSYGGDRAASARYTEFQLTDFCRDILFNGINFKTIPTEPTEDLKDREIQYFIPKIPTALLFHNESVGFGYSSRTVPLKFENICDIVIDYVSCKDKINWDYSKLAHLFVPCLPIHTHLRNRQDLINAYRKGKFTHPIETEGIYKILSNNSVLIRTLAYGIAPSAIRSSLMSSSSDKNHWMQKFEVGFDALSEDQNYIDFRLTAKRGTNIFELIEIAQGMLRIRNNTHVCNNYVFNEKMVNMNPPEIVKMWYKERYRSIFSSKKHRQQELQMLQMRLTTYLIVCDHVDEVINIIRDVNSSMEDIYTNLKKRFELSTRQCEILLNSNLQLLMKSKRDELEEKLNKVKHEFNMINESFLHIDDEICDEIRTLKKKYKTNTSFISKEPKYIGCMIIEDLGMIQISSEDEIIDIAKIFNNNNVRVVLYGTGVKNIRFAKCSTSFKDISSLPYTTNVAGVCITYKHKSFHFSRIDGKSVCVPSNTVILNTNRAITNTVSDSPWVIQTDGKVVRAPESLFDTRLKSTNILYAFDLINGIDEYVVISVNAAHPNVVRFQPIKLKNKVMFSGAGETAILAVVPKGVDSLIVHTPKFHKNQLMHLTDINKHIKGGKLIDVNLKHFVRK